jgi:methionyl-tRNA synthetase
MKSILSRRKKKRRRRRDSEEGKAERIQIVEKYRRILVTSALPYANGPLHLGHIAGAYLPADIYVRYQRLKGRDVIYICGSDEHGVPITVTADREGISPQDVVDRYHEMNKKSFEELGICFDHYSRTSLPLHHETAKEFFLDLHRKGDLVVRMAEQFYSEKSQRFLPDRYVEGTCPYCGAENARGDQCDACGKWLDPGDLIDPRSKIDGSIPVLKETMHWYLPMGRFASAWKKWFESRSWKENVEKYCVGWYNEGLEDRPITRDLHWGVPVPLEEAEGKVLYVWFDAPIGYISATKEWALLSGEPEAWKRYWTRQDTRMIHFIGKDNIVFHAILFPMVLMEAGGYVLPDAIPANEYLTIEGRKISTSQNYAIWVKDYLENFPVDPLRYTLAANAPETRDTDFSWSQFQSRNNDELADILGNFVNRTLTFVHRYYEGRIPERKMEGVSDRGMLKTIHGAVDEMGGLLENFQVRKATKYFMDVCRKANKYFNDKAPWETRKTNPDDCDTTLNICIQITRVLSAMMAPIMPDTGTKIQTMLGYKESVSWDEVRSGDLEAGWSLNEPEILFEKIEDSVIRKEIEKLKTIEEKGETGRPEDTDLIDYETFKKILLQTAIVLSAEKIKGADRLLKLEIQLGEEKRCIVAGVAESYTAEEMVGKTVIVVANLKPVTMKGVESRGMLLAVKTGEGYSLVTTDRATDSGIRAE